MSAAPRFALIGKSGSGKSEVANILSEIVGCRVIKTGSICREIAHLLFGNEDKRSTQMLDDALTTINPSIFVHAAVRGIKAEESVVIDALRFITDVDVAKKLGCTVIRVEAGETDRLHRLVARGQVFDADRDGQHRSETELDNYPAHHVIINQGTMYDLRLEVTKTFVLPPE